MLRLGIIGLSSGNGHPYSWSAIFNGYDPQIMETCAFPVIPRYLEKRKFPDDQISGARVTHIWTQDRSLSLHIAAATRIGTIVDRFEDMLDEVDAVLLARDDAERHIEFALPFLRAGMPIYIDKPLALSCSDAYTLLSAQRYTGQLYTCSALRYAKEFQLSTAERASIGSIKQIHAITPKSWEKYAVHVIEPALQLLDAGENTFVSKSFRTEDSTTLMAKFSTGQQLLVTSLGAAAAPTALRVIGTSGWQDLYFQDSFNAFRSALIQFTESVRIRRPVIPESFVMRVVALIEAGRAP